MTSKYKNLIQWIINNGGTIGNIEIKKYGKKSERCVISSKHIRNNKSIIKIPKNIIIHDGMGGESAYGQQLLRGNFSNINNLKIALVCIFMLDDMRKNSFFLPYYQILPDNIANFPIFWNKRTLSLLTGSSMIEKIETRKKNFYNDYKVICKCCPDFSKEYSFREFLFVRVLVGSRNFGIRIDGIKRVAMIPASDMLNHSPNPNVQWYYDNNKNSFIMKSNQSISTHSQITDTYGNKCNSQMLLYYGFALPNNSYNTLYINFTNNTSRTRAEKKRFELQSNIEGELRMSLNDPITKNLFTFLRISSANDTELSRNAYKLNYKQPISLENEINMLLQLIIYMNQLQDNYALSYNKVCDIIDSFDKNEQEYLALLLIKSELEIINYFLNFSHTMIRSIKTNLPPKDKMLHNYFNSVMSCL